MVHMFLMLHLVAVCSLVREVGTAYAAEGNGHTAKKSPMDFSRYAEDARQISNHNPVHDPRPGHTCDERYEVRNTTIIRTTDSLDGGAEFVGGMKVAGGATECRWRCCQKNGKCDTAIFVDDNSKDKNCFLFSCRFGGTQRCKFSSHKGYVSAMIGGFSVAPTRPSEVMTDTDMNMNDNPVMTSDKEDSPQDSENDPAENDKDEGIEDDGIDNDSDMTAGDNKDVPEVDTTKCARGQIQCASGECIVARYVCNDVEDCADGSDEMGCRYGSWKQWNEYNHRGGSSPPQIGSQKEVDYPQDDRHGDADTDTDRIDDVKSDVDGGEDDQVSEDLPVFGDKDDRPQEEKTPIVIATEANRESVDSPTVQPPSKTDVGKAVQPALSDQESSNGHQDVTPKVTSHVDVAKTEQTDGVSSVKVEPFGSRPPTSAILPLAMGLIITLLLLMMLSCRLRYMNRRLRYGRLKTHAHDADYLINGMYL